MFYDDFIKKYVGKATDYDGAYKAQCVDLIKAYLHDGWGLNPGAWGNAHAYYDNFNNRPELTKHFTRIANTSSLVPQKGDIVVWKKGSGFPYGHIAIATGEGNTSWFTSYDQNWTGRNDACTKIKHNYNMVSGVLRPKDRSKVTAGTTTSTAKTSGTPNKTCKWKGKVTTSALNVRTWAGTEYNRFMVIGGGKEVEVCDTVKARNGEDWYYVKVNGKYGFVSAKYIA